MCYKPVRITNNTKALRASDATSILAPCGDCEECRTIRACEYTFRIYNEMEYRHNNGYNIYFFTLTYGDACLPHSAVTNKYNKSVNITCFRRSDVTSFFKHIRKYLLKKYNITNISYCCASEYGSHTQRPHYHAMLALPSKAKHLGKWIDITSEMIHDLVTKYWTFGFVFPRYSLGGIDSHGYVHKPFQVQGKDIKSAAFYIAKYCCKDLSFYGLPSVQLYQKLVKECMSAKDITDEGKLYYKRLLHDHLTFVITSRHFGEHINDLVKNAEDLINGVDTTMNLEKLVPVPMYNKRKLIYKVRTVKEDPTIKVFDKYITYIKEHNQYIDWQDFCNMLHSGEINYQSIEEVKKAVYKYKVRYDLTPLGMQYSKLYLRDRIKRTEDSIKEFFDTTVNTQQFRNWFEENMSTYDYSYGGVKDLVSAGSTGMFVHKWKSYLYKNIHDLAVYAVVYRNRTSPLHLQMYMDDADCFRPTLSKFKTYVDATGKTVIPKKLKRCDVVWNPETKKFVPTDTIYDIVQDECFVQYSDIYKYQDINWTSAENVIFLGTENLMQMSNLAEKFYLKNLDIDRYVDEGKVDLKNVQGQQFVYFNSFPCFKGFDEFLTVMSNYKKTQNESIYETRAEKNRQLQQYKQALTEVEY